MPVIINGSTGISGNDGTAAVPTIQGTDTNTGMFFPAADTIAFAEGGVEAMRLDASGNVGIGTTSGGTRLDVSGTSIVGRFNSSNNLNVLAISYAGTIGGYLGASGTNFLLADANGVERARITTGGDFQFNSGYGSVATAYGCRAWVNFNGTGTIAVRGSGNVSSITDNGVGDYTVNMTSAMPDTNYAVNVNVGFTSPADYMLTPMVGQNSAYGQVAPTTSAVRYVLWNYNTSAQRDATYNFVSIFR